MKFVIIFLFLAFANLAYAESPSACGKITFTPSLSCEKTEVKFDISSCDEKAKDQQPASSISCNQGELLATLVFNQFQYQAKLIKHIDGKWTQQGEVLKSNDPNKIKVVSQKPKKLIKKEVLQKVKVVEKVKAVENSVQVSLPMPVPDKKDWNFSFSGWFFAEQESLKNIGDGVANILDSNDPLSEQSNTNILSNLQFTLSKANLKFDSILEVGEVFYGDSTSGGNQGLRARNIELRNFNVEEKYGTDWYAKVGLMTINADPRGFILSDHHAGFQLKKENESGAYLIWYARALDGQPTTPQIRDTYVGFNRYQTVSEKFNYNLFAVARSTKETFYDADIAANSFGTSMYYWLGLNAIHTKILENTNLEYNLIANQSQFKSDDGLSRDHNFSWLVHTRIDQELTSQWALGLDLLGTSGSSDSRESGVKILGKRSEFSSPDPGQSYLLMIATSDSGDDAPGSVRAVASNQLARLDLDEGLRIGVLNINYKPYENFETLLRYGQIESAHENLLTGSTKYGSEIDLRLKYNVSPITSWTLEAGQFTPGAYFSQLDTATLYALKYKVQL